MAITTSFIQDTDLVEFVPDILGFGVADFSTQNLRASDDVFERLLNEWWPQAISRFYGLTRQNIDTMFPTLPTLDVNKLDTAALKPLTCYRALGHYILPLLAGDADANGDLFTRRADRYDRFYSEEWKKVIRLPLYDFNADGAFSMVERKRAIGRRLVRA